MLLFLPTQVLVVEIVCLSFSLEPLSTAHTGNRNDDAARIPFVVGQKSG